MIQTASPENVLIQQIVYGCFKEKPTLQVSKSIAVPPTVPKSNEELFCFLQCFIDVFYGDNASRVLRVDMTMYTVVTYLSVFRLEELGISRFREICSSQEPSKISFFVAYLFNKV